MDCAPAFTAQTASTQPYPGAAAQAALHRADRARPPARNARGLIRSTIIPTATWPSAYITANSVAMSPASVWVRAKASIRDGSSMERLVRQR